MMDKRFKILLFCAIVALSCANVTPHDSKCRVQLFRSMIIRLHENSCKARVAMKQCIGACRSVDKYPLGKGSTICTCCQPVRFVRRQLTAKFFCSDRNNNFFLQKKTILIHEPAMCVCKPCRKTK